MKRISSKATAEAALREIPSVLGAYVSEDADGHPREVHLLVRPGPDPAGLARDIRGLLEERLGIPIDQRVISIAQLARDPRSGTEEASHEEASHEEASHVEASHEGEPYEGATVAPADPVAADGRPVFVGLESTTTGGRVRVVVRLEWRSEESEGVGEAVDTRPGRARAAATATLRSAVNAPWNDGLGLELDFASIVQALDGEYVLVSVLGIADRLGRRPLPLVGAHPMEGDLESAAALAALKAINRVLSLALRRD
ncbi:MAG: hypothetical protein ACOCVZ_08905 [Gemmatimonadota bacterium]